MTDVQVRGKKIALLDSSDNIIYTLPDSAGTAGNAMVTDGAGKLFFGGINLNSVLTAGDSSNLNATILGNVTIRDLTVTRSFTDISFQGGIGANATHGYTSGGRNSPPGNSQVKSGTRFSFTSTSTETIGDTLNTAVEFASGFASSTHGYSAGGRHSAPTAVAVNEIVKFPFASSSSDTDVGDLITAKLSNSTNGQQSLTHGYTSGGKLAPGTRINVIEKVSLSVDGNSTDVGDLIDTRDLGSGSSSSTHGYLAGGGIPPSGGVTNVIQKFPFASDTNAADVGDLNIVNTEAGGVSSGSHGYTGGGRTASPGGGSRTDIQKFSFVVDANGTDVGDLTQDRTGTSGHSSQEFGFISGGGSFPPFNTRGRIDRFGFSADANSVLYDFLDASPTVGERYGHSGTQG